MTPLSATPAATTQGLVALDPLLDLAPCGACVFDRDLRLASANRVAREMLGAAAQAGLPIGDLVAALWSVDDQAEVLREFRRVLAFGERGCTTAPAADTACGSEWELRRMPVGTDQGVVAYFHAISGQERAEGAHRAAERRLRDSEERLSLAAEHVGICIWDLDLVTLKAYWSRTHFEVFGLPPTDDGSSSYELWFSGIHPDDREQVREHWRRALDDPNGRYRDDYRIVRADDGETRWVSVNGRLLFGLGGEPVRCVGVLIDITDRKRAETELRRQREELQTMLDVLPVGVAIAQDRDGEQVYLSPAFTQMLGLTDSDGRPVTQQRGVTSYGYRFLRDGQPVPVSELPLSLAMRAGQGIRDAELEVLREDGRRLNLLCSAAPLFDASGQVRGAVSVNMDVTTLKHAQRELEAADRQKDEFLAMLAHELRNPLAPVRTASEVLARIVDEPRAQAAIGVIRRQSAHLSRLVDDLLDVSRITRGRVELRRAPVDLADVIAQAVESVEPQRQEKRHELRVVADPARTCVDGDFARLLQSFVNLLSNAIKYTGPGGHIEVRTRIVEGQAIVEVSDDGVGIPPELLPRVFDLFVQSDRALDRAQGGLGIGLSVVQRLVQKHGGDVAASSDGPGRGARFVVRLPLMVDPPQPGNDRPASAAVTRRVLVVDDNVDAADSLALMLSLDGHATQVAYGAVEALARCPVFGPDIVLLDIGLPEMDGYEVARRLRGLPGGTALRIVALTGYGQPEDRERAFSAGFDAHLVKPAEFDILKGLLADDLPAPPRSA